MIARRALMAAALALAFAAPACASPAASPDPLADVADLDEDPFPAFADFAWRAFLAANWPADRAARLGDPGPRVWETYEADWQALARVGEAGANPCGAPATARVVSAFTPFAEFNQTTFTPGQPGPPLVARNGTYVRYESRFDGKAADWLAAPGAAVPLGAVAVKAAWRIIGSDDPARGRYYLTKGAWVTDVAKSRESGGIVCTRADLALVGIHVVVRTASQPQGVWATFEHVDNVPPAGLGDAREPDARAEGGAYAFNDPAGQQREITPPEGWAAAAPVSRENPPRLAPTPAQVLRKHPIRSEIMVANRAYWALPAVAGSVWRRYMLTSVQWPTVITPRGPENDGRYFPGLKPAPQSKAAKYKVDEGDDGRNLANAAMETYAQDPPSSCMACHHAVGNATGHDFVGVLARAGRDE